jgi:hypothetical protein
MEKQWRRLESMGESRKEREKRSRPRELLAGAGLKRYGFGGCGMAYGT